MRNPRISHSGIGRHPRGQGAARVGPFLAFGRAGGAGRGFLRPRRERCGCGEQCGDGGARGRELRGLP